MAARPSGYLQQPLHPFSKELRQVYAFDTTPQRLVWSTGFIQSGTNRVAIHGLKYSSSLSAVSTRPLCSTRKVLIVENGVEAD